MGSADDLDTPLHDVTFVVLDLETTGVSAAACDVTEVGAVKLRGGECLGTFHTLVDPSVAIAPVPPIDAVLPMLLEFVGGAVVVGHNVRFDIRFLEAAADRLGYGPLPNLFVDTCALARRLVGDEVPDCTLGTLALRFRTAVSPSHRAFDDARATAEVFHALLERAGSIGVDALDDLLALPATGGHPQASKLRWVASLPRAPGVYVFRDRGGHAVYVFRDRGGHAVYVGAAADLRRQVRGYFAGNERRRIGAPLREAHSLDHVVCESEPQAGMVAERMIEELRPTFNLRGRRRTTTKKKARGGAT